MKIYKFEKIVHVPVPKPDHAEVHENIDDDDPFGDAEDMESVDYSDDEFNLPRPTQGDAYRNVCVHGPSKGLHGELHASSDDEDLDVHPNEVHACGSNKSGIGASALPNPGVNGAFAPGISS